MAEVELTSVCKSYDNTVVIREASLSIQDKEFIVLVGPSGCGKSTLLRMIAGLETVTAGTIQIAGQIVNHVPPKDRDIAMVFQNYALYPHMSVYDNMAFGLKMRKFSKALIAEKVQQAASILDLQDLLNRKPKQLSGGQRQRVALGRAIVRDPKVFLMDEPLSNLDAKLRVQMRSEIGKLHQRLNATTIYVTHDQVEAMTMGDRIVILNQGEIQQVDTPLGAYQQPNNAFVAGFVGQMNFLPGTLEPGAVRLSDGTCIALPETLQGVSNRYDGTAVKLGFRPEHFQPAEVVDEPGQTLYLVPEHVELLGNEQIIHTKLASLPVISRCRSDLAVPCQSPSTRVQTPTLKFTLMTNRLYLFDAQSLERLRYE
jgi:multiple sugar transport system ATP-binding protein